MGARCLLPISLILVGLTACGTNHSARRMGPGMHGTGMPSARDIDATQQTIEHELARESSGNRAPRGYENWHEYWTDCLWHWHYTERGGERWIAYTMRRRDELHLPAIWNWT